MSDMEARKGRIRKIDHINGFTNLDAIVIELVKKLNIVDKYEHCLEESGDAEEAFLETIYDTEFYKKYTFLENDLYEVYEDVELDPYGFSEIVRNEDGSISYFALWYNGGGSLEETLEYALKKEREF